MMILSPAKIPIGIKIYHLIIHLVVFGKSVILEKKVHEIFSQSGYIYRYR